jgi:hypothetical protein
MIFINILKGDNMKKVKMINLGGQIVMGEPGISHEKPFIKNPRVLSISDAGGGKGQAVFMQIVGNPEELFYNEDHVSWHYIVTHSNLVNTYIESTTGIVIPGLSIPQQKMN